MDTEKLDGVMMLSGYVLCPLIAYVALQADEIIGLVLALPLGFLLVYCGDLRGKLRKARALLSSGRTDEDLGPDPLG
ncbi:hypothetical protein N9393_01310 [Luminiphilus sp.]|nr:hypothetical protein [Luminiphilus sp.]